MKKIETIFMAFFMALVVVSGCSDYLTGTATVDVDLKLALRPLVIRDTTVITETKIEVKKEIVEKIDTQYIYIPGEDRIDTVFTNTTDTLYVTVEVEVDKIIHHADTVYLPGEKVTDTLYIDRTDTLYKEIIIKEGLDTVLFGSPITISKQLVGMNEYIVVDGQIVETNLLKANRKFDLEAGEEICVKAEPKLLSTTAKVNGNECSYEYNADTKCQDCWTVSCDSRVTFTATNGKKINRTLDEEWMPVSLAFYNAAENRYEHLVAATVNDVIQDMDVQVITVEKEPVVKPADYTISGYRLVRADQTDAYDANRTTWHSTPICAWFESISNPSNTLFVAFDETTGKEIEASREVTTGQTLPTYPLARVWNSSKGKFEAGFVYVEPNIYTYYRLDRSYHAAVSAVSTSTASKLRDPYQGSGVYDDVMETTTFTLSNGKKLILK